MGDKRTIELSDKDMPGLKGKTIGDSVSVKVMGKIIEVRQQTEYDTKKNESKETGAICYRLEINSFNGKESKRIKTEAVPIQEED